MLLGTGFGVLGALDGSLLFCFCDLFREGLENCFFVLLAFERIGEVVTFVFTLVLDIFGIASFRYHLRGGFNMILFSHHRALKLTEIQEFRI